MEHILNVDKIDSSELELLLDIEAIDKIKKVVSQGFTGDWDYLMDVAYYNGDDYNSSYEESSEILRKLDVFRILKDTKRYEEIFHGSVDTDLANPVEVLNSLITRKGHFFIDIIYDSFDYIDINDGNRKDILNEIEGIVVELINKREYD